MPNLPLLPNTPVVDGTQWSVDLANLALNSPVFDDQPQYLMHRARITDDELSNSSGAIKQRVSSLETGLKVTAVSGLTVSIAAGTYRKQSGVISVPVTQLTVPDNTASYVYIASDGTLSVSTTPTVVRILLAKVTASGGSISTIDDLRYPASPHMLPAASSIKSFGGTSATDINCTNGQLLDQGFYYCRNFTVPAGATVTIDRYAKILCSGDFTINGTLIVNPLASGAPGSPYALSSLGSSGGVPGSGLGGRGQAYPWGASKQGSGGGQGQLVSSTTSWGYSWAGGDGGGCIEVEVAGKILVTGTIQAIGSDGGKGGTNYPAGGSGVTGSGNYAIISGSGGGSGGLIYLASLTSITVATGGTIDVRGGKGGDALAYVASGNTYAIGGSGGGGGWFVCCSPSNNTTGANILLSGGKCGNCSGSGTFANPSPGVYTVSSANLGIGAANGGAFGGNSGGYATTGTGTQTLTAVDGGVGKAVYNNFIPVG